MVILGIDVNEGDVIRVTGATCSPIGYETDLLCTVATLSKSKVGDADDFDAVKVWPNDPKHPSGGKVWLPIAKIINLEVVAE